MSRISRREPDVLGKAPPSGPAAAQDVVGQRALHCPSPGAAPQVVVAAADDLEMSHPLRLTGQMAWARPGGVMQSLSTSWHCGRRIVPRDFTGAAVGVVVSIGYLWAIWDSQNQTPHDTVAGTIVVRD